MAGKQGPSGHHRPSKKDLDPIPRGIEKSQGWWVSLEYASSFVGGSEWWAVTGYEDRIVPVKQYDGRDPDDDDDDDEFSDGDSAPGNAPHDKPIWMYENGNMYLGPWIRLGSKKKKAKKAGALKDVVSIPLEHGYGTMYMHFPEKFRGQIYVGNWYQGRWHNMGKTSYLPTAPSWINNRLPKSQVKQPTDDVVEDPSTGKSIIKTRWVARPFLYMGLFEYGCMMDPEGATVVLKDGTTKIGIWNYDIPDGDWWKDHKQLPPALELLAASIPPTSGSNISIGSSPSFKAKAHPKHRLLHKNKKHRSRNDAPDAASDDSKEKSAPRKKTLKSKPSSRRKLDLSDEDDDDKDYTEKGPGKKPAAGGNSRKTPPDTKKSASATTAKKKSDSGKNDANDADSSNSNKRKRSPAHLQEQDDKEPPIVASRPSRHDVYRGLRGDKGKWISFAQAKKLTCGDGEEWWKSPIIDDKKTLAKPVWRYDNGDMYRGDWKYNPTFDRYLEDGKGAMYNHSPANLQGLVYIGEFNVGFCNGKGESGWLPSCKTWKNDHFVGSNVKILDNQGKPLPFIYNGRFAYGRKSDKGAFVQLKDGTTRVGPWEDGHPVGDWRTSHRPDNVATVAGSDGRASKPAIKAAKTTTKKRGSPTHRLMANGGKGQVEANPPKKLRPTPTESRPVATTSVVLNPSDSIETKTAKPPTRRVSQPAESSVDNGPSGKQAPQHDLLLKPASKQEPKVIVDDQSNPINVTSGEETESDNEISTQKLQSSKRSPSKNTPGRKKKALPIHHKTTTHAKKHQTSPKRKATPDLKTFISQQKSCLKCRPDEFVEWLESEDITTVAELSEATSDVNFVSSYMKDNGLRGFKRGSFIQAVEEACALQPPSPGRKAKK